MFRRLKFKFKTFFRNIYRLIRWFPIIWNDRDWDWNYLMFILEKKLYHMGELHEIHGNSVSSQEISEQLMLASNLAGRIANEDYSNEVRALPEFQDRVSEVFDSNESWNVDRKASDKETKLLVDIRRKEKELMNEDIEELFELMKKNLLTWWD